MQKYSSLLPTKSLFALIICYSICVALSGCKQNSTKEPLKTDQVKMNYRSIRFDQKFLNLNQDNLYASLDSLGRNYPDFTGLYVERIAALGELGTPQFDTAIRQFFTHKEYLALWDTVAAHFPDTKTLDEELESTLKNIKYFYPEEGFGKVYYFVSGLNRFSAITIDSIVGVGLDMYLGPEFPHYSTLRVPINNYELHNRAPYRIPVDVARAIFKDKFPYQYEGKSLLDMMLYEGKKLYFAEQVCRTKQDFEIVGYTPEQAQWCQDNEQDIYYFFAKGEKLYSTSWQEIMPFVNDGPNTAGMPAQSPGNIGSWLGWQIVRQYMKQNPQETLQTLMNNELAGQQFLRAAKYKP